MKYTPFFFIILLIFILSFSVKSLSIEEKIQTQDQDFANLQANSVVGTIKPYKLKFCKSVGNNHELSTFTVLKNQSCSLMRYDSTTFNSKMFRGKKISKQNYIKQNPDFSEQSNLICISDNNIFFITHTPSNKVYLNSILSRKHYLGDKTKKDYNLSKIDFNDLSWLNNNISNGFLRDSKLTHQGIPTFSSSEYVFNFDNYYGEDKGVQHGVIDGPYLTIDNYYKNNSFGQLRCYASKKYWQTMFVNKGINISSSASIIAQNSYYNESIAENKVAQSQTSSEQVSQETEVVQTTLDKKSLKEELLYWKELFQDELITQAEYDAKRKELLSGATITKKVVTKKKEPKKTTTKVSQNNNSSNVKSVQVDMSYKNKNYVQSHLKNQKNLGKITAYCESKYPNFWEFQVCEEQHAKTIKKWYRGGRQEFAQVFYAYGELLAYQVLGGEISNQQARYLHVQKKHELEDAYQSKSAAKWTSIIQNLATIEDSFNLYNRNQTAPQNSSGFNGFKTCNLTNTVKGNSTHGGTITCF